MHNQDTHKVENSSAKAHAGTAEIGPTVGKRTLWSGRSLQFWLFCVLLGLALIGMGLTQATEGGGTLYWLIVLWVYALFSLVRAWLQAKQRHESIWSEIHLHLLHWLGALVALHIILVLEHHDILARDAASDVSLVVLALASYLAGLHFERLFVLIGIILAIMAVVGAFVEQYTLWLIVIPASLVAAWLFLKSKLSQTNT
jgi:hypothetical protein